MAEFGDEGLADAAPADRELEVILRHRALRQQQAGDSGADQRSRPEHKRSSPTPEWAG